MPNIINLSSFFYAIENEQYVVIKPSTNLPNYTSGSDVDIFCYNPNKMIELITQFLSDYIDDNCNIKVVDSESKSHVDFVVDGKIEFRFDIYKMLPTYNNISLKPSFFSSVIESSVTKEYSNECGSVTIKVPSSVDDFILRYVEYQEYYSKRPDKIKHIKYIEKYFSELDKKLALDKLHFYTAFPQEKYKAKTSAEKMSEKIGYYSDMLTKVKHVYQNGGIKSIFRKVKGKLG